MNHLHGTCSWLISCTELSKHVLSSGQSIGLVFHTPLWACITKHTPSWISALLTSLAPFYVQYLHCFSDFSSSMVHTFNVLWTVEEGKIFNAIFCFICYIYSLDFFKSQKLLKKGMIYSNYPFIALSLLYWSEMKDDLCNTLHKVLFHTFWGQ